MQHRHFRPTRSQARGIWTHRSDRSDRSARRRTSGASLAPEKADASGSGATTAPVPEEDVWRWSTTSDAVITYGVFLGVLALGTVPQVQSMSQSGLFYFISLAVGIDLDRRALALRSSLFALRSSLFARPDFPTLLLTPRASLVPRSPGVFVLVGLNIDKTWAQVGVGLDRRALARPDSLTRYALFALRCCSESLRFPYPPSSSCGSCGCTTGSQEENGRPRCPPHTRTARLASLARSPFFFVSCSTAPRSSSPRLQNPHLLLPTRSCSAQRHERAALVCSNPRSISSPKASRLRNPRSAGASAIFQ